MAYKKILLALILIVFGSTLIWGGTIKSDSNGDLTYNNLLVAIADNTSYLRNPSGTILNLTGSNPQWNGNNICLDDSSKNYEFNKLDLKYLDVNNPDGSANTILAGFDGTTHFYGKGTSDYSKYNRVILYGLSDGVTDQGTGETGRIQLQFTHAADRNVNSQALGINTHLNLAQPHHVTFYTNVKNGSWGGKAFEWMWNTDSDGVIKMPTLNQFVIESEGWTGFYSNESEVSSAFQTYDNELRIGVDYNGNEANNEVIIFERDNGVQLMNITNREISTELPIIDSSSIQRLDINNPSWYVTGGTKITEASGTEFSEDYSNNKRDAYFYGTMDIGTDGFEFRDGGKLVVNSPGIKTNNEMTMVFNINLNGSVGGTEYLFSKGFTSSEHLFIYMVNKQLRIRVGYNSSATQTWYSSSALNTDEDIILTIAFDDGALSIYQNENLLASYTMSYSVPNFDFDTSISRDGAAEALNADVDHIMFFDRVLSRAEIREFNSKRYHNLINIKGMRENPTIYNGISMYSPDGTLWTCSPDNSGNFTCS